MAYGDLEGPNNPTHQVRFSAVGVPVSFVVAVSGQDADGADLDAAVQNIVDLVAGADGFTFVSALKSADYAQSITPTGGA